MSATCLSWAICIEACDCCFGWIRFCHWAGRGEGLDNCNVLNHVQSSAGLQQACLRFKTRFFVWREVVQAVFCHRCYSSCQTLKDRGAWTLLDSKSPCPHSAAYHNIARWGEGGATWASASKPAGTASMTDVQVLSMLFCFGFENGAAKQQLQKWELKFVTELEPLEGTSPVASRGKQMVSKERLQNWHQFWVSICVFGDPILAPQFHWSLFQNGHRNGPHRFQKWGCVAGPFLVPHFVNNLAWLWHWLWPARRERKERNATPKNWNCLNLARWINVFWNSITR